MFAFNRDFRNTLVGRVMLHASASNTALQHLRHLNINIDDDDEALPLSDLGDVLGLPGLRSIRGYNVELCGLDLERFKDLRSSPHANMKEITLERSFIDCPGGMEALLRAYECLEVLLIQRSRYMSARAGVAKGRLFRHW